MSPTQSLYESHGQGHVFRYFEELDAAAQASLIHQAESIDLKELATLVEQLIKKQGTSDSPTLDDLEPATYIPLPDAPQGNPSDWVEAKRRGEAALRTGRVAAFTVAGGQGSRLGYEGPKGFYGISPVLKKSFFQLFAEKLLASARIFGRPIPWYILTSPTNHQATSDYFEQHGYFGLPENRVHFVTQGSMPSVDEEGRILMAGKGEIALNPDGHGGSLRALVRSGAIRQMEADGIDLISYFQVDNPLVRCIDPAFIGFHLLHDAEVSSKMVPKTVPEEKVGLFCQRQGRSVVVEYSDLPPHLVQERDDTGELKYRAGNVAIHLFNRDFVGRLGSDQDTSGRLPFHLAHKKVPYLDEHGTLIQPDTPNAWKFEMFVFDSLPAAKHPIILETSRLEEFSPVKNATGTDSPASATQDQLRQFARWANAAGLDVPTDETGLPPFNFEVSPLFADTDFRFQKAWEKLEYKPELTEGVVLV